MKNARTAIDPITVIGLIAVLGPLLTMAHELGGHALACLATGNVLTELGAYYVNCSASSLWGQRVVAAAGPSVDILLAVLGWLAWRVLRQPLARLAAWVVAVFKGLVAAGYWLFSGVVGIGDWAPGAHGGMGMMAYPWLWRAVLTVVGLVAYIAVVRWAMRGIDAMLGGGVLAQGVRRRSVLLMYATNGAIAILVGLFNPVGFWIILASAAASSFGGLAGLFNVAYRAPQPGRPEPFCVERSYTLLVLGLLTSAVFAVILGPTIVPG